MSLHKIVTEHRDKILRKPKRDASLLPEKLTYKKDSVGDVRGLCERLVETMSKKMLGTCSLCFDDKIPIARLRDACGHCTHRCCEDCLKSWYVQNQPGKLFLEARARCPFCRSFPVFDVMRFMNREIYAIRARDETISKRGLRSDMYYAWCIQCYRIREAMPRRCAMGSIPDLKKFICEMCIENKLGFENLENAKSALSILPNSRTCPKCKNLVLKTSGCDHIICVCGAHWCFRCESMFQDAASTYEHMATCNKSLFGVSRKAEKMFLTRKAEKMFLISNIKKKNGCKEWELFRKKNFRSSKSDDEEEEEEEEKNHTT
jgi:hypothetical protein